MRKNFFENLKAFVNTCINNKLPLAIWRNPNDFNIHAITSLSGIKSFNEIMFSEQSGFVFSSFSGEKTLFIKKDAYLSSNNKEIIYLEENESFHKAYLEKLSDNNIDIKWFTPSIEKEIINYKKNDFYKLVDDSVAEIKKGEIKKIVVSRTFPVEKNDKRDLIKAFSSLCEMYPTAFVSLVSIPEIGTWIGATPETLLKITNNILETMALAGTKPFISGAELEKTQWSNKDIEEHELVADYVKEVLSANQLAFNKRDRYPVRAGNIIHLRTDFKSEIVKYLDFNSLIKALHPTPAVCGVPKRLAFEFILKNELHNRKFYAGFLGPVNIERNTGLFVNLRCMEVLEKAYLLYVGCGIVKDSVAENEWEETENKAKIILSVLNS